jgi:hypothetical protein
MLRFKNAAEQAAWTMAEALSEKAFAAMRQAEEAADAFRNGKQLTRRQFKQRGLTEADADIRWAGTTQARKALSNNGWYMSQATMYHEAAGAQYAKALYLSQHEADAGQTAPGQRQTTDAERENGRRRSDSPDSGTERLRPS